jgi:prepilin signal peptidase PulO-like enzyme (type II secretory pathway)
MGGLMAYSLVPVGWPSLIVGVLSGLVGGLAAGWAAPRWLERPDRLHGWAVGLLALWMAALGGIAADVSGGITPPFWARLLFLLLLSSASLVDLYEKLIPDELVVAGLAAGGALLLTGSFPGGPPLLALGGALTALALLFFVFWIARGGFGFGDVKLAAMIGLFLGFPWVLLGLVLAFVGGGFLGGLLLLFRIVGRRSTLPFGPWLALGAIVTALWGERIWGWYLGIY